VDRQPPERALRVYRLLLRLVPGDVRDRFSGDMEELFALRLASARGRAGRARVWARALGDVVLHAALEHAGRITRTGGEETMAHGFQDMRYALRALTRAPVLTGVVVATLALGIGSTTATFSVVNGVLLEPLPYPEPHRLVSLWTEMNFNTAMVYEALEASPALESASGYSGWVFTLTGEGEPLEVEGARVSPDHFRVLGVPPALGRDFTAEEGLPGNDDVAVLSHGLWVRAFGADPDVLGRRIALATNDVDSRVVVGVMPPDFRPLVDDPEVWVPLSLAPGTDMAGDDTWYVNHRVARLAPGATVAQASEQMREFASEALARMPRLVDEEDVRSADARPLAEVVAGSVGPVLWAALGSVFLVLLMACANVANLLLARGEARTHDAVLGLLGGAAGVALSFGLVRLVVALAPADFPRVRDIAVDGPVLAFALAATLVATLLAGLVPALRTSRVEATASLGRAGRSAGARRSSRLTPALVGVQVALAVVVVVGSGLMLRSLSRMTAEDPGLRTDGVVVFRPNPPAGRYPDGAAYEAYYAQVMERLRALPEVEGAAAIQLLPGTVNNWSFPTYPEGVDLGEGSVPSVNIRLVTPGYFETLGLPLSRGRALTATDDADDEKVVVVNEAFVERFWPGEDPLGRTLRIMGATTPPHRVVGVVADVRQHGFGRDPRPEMYFAHAQLGWNATFWVVARMRPGVEPLASAGAIRDAVWAVDPDVPVAGLDELSRIFDASADTTRFLTAVLGTFGALALLLGAVGVFGVTTFTVGRRTPEFGVRIALGAGGREVLGSALGRSLLPVAAGLVLGLAAAAVATRALESALYQVEPSDPLTYAAVGFTLAAVATLAALLPAWRASRLDPVLVLSRE
jgi:hypothetical protein